MFCFFFSGEAYKALTTQIYELNQKSTLSIRVRWMTGRTPKAMSYISQPGIYGHNV
jgi:hypothetical protein